MPVEFRFDDLIRARSRRSPVLSLDGIVASSHPLASQAGAQVLRAGGNAADAAVACAAVLNVVEPMSTGLGGDAFALFFNADKKRVFGLNGSGRAPARLDLQKLRKDGIEGRSIPANSPHAVTVPGACACWVDTVEMFGRLTMKEVLEPAIHLASRGHPVAPLIAAAWFGGVGRLRKMPNGHELLMEGTRAPEPGEIFKNKNLADVLQEIVKNGKDGFYKGWVAREIVSVLEDLGGVMSLDDLASHSSVPVEPISVNYRGIDVYEIPPNGQGITALIALNILEGFDLGSLEPSSPGYYHLLVESLRLAFADAKRYVADPEFSQVPVDGLLSKEYAARRRTLVDETRAMDNIEPGQPGTSSDTVYLAVVDGEGNACSFINSNYMSFGTGIVPRGCGFVLQNRGCNFVLDPGHPNCLEPGKRPYHTIIPAMSMEKGELHACFGVMGGFMQPQGHVQVLSRIVDHGQDPQAALDEPRFCIEGGNPAGTLLLEEGIPTATASKLSAMGHRIRMVSGLARSVFGRGQVIRRDPDTGVLWGGSDPRSDGCAIGL